VTATIQLTPEQQAVVDFAVARIMSGEKLTTIGGYAGTGKTTCTGAIVNGVREKDPDARFAFACYTGKAKSVLEQKLRAAEALKEGYDFCGTLHSLLYRPLTSYFHDEEKKTIEKQVTFQSAEARSAGIKAVIVDEASMIDERIFRELQQFGAPILAIGDHGQLPPVFGSFSLMTDPMVKLEKIHRQAEGNPIIRASIMARIDGHIPFGTIGEGVVKTADGSVVNLIPDIASWTLICGTNRKRCRLNSWMRHKILGSNATDPVPGDRVICLQNNHKMKIFNGMIGTVEGLQVEDKHWYRAQINMGDFVYAGRVFRWQFGKEKTLKKTVPEAPDVHPDNFEDLFDYGYCLTAHKAQGSEADNVVVYEEEAMRAMLKRQHGEEGWRRWLYTATTRARKRLIIIGE
jgi:exodeoxyribonuclease V